MTRKTQIKRWPREEDESRGREYIPRSKGIREKGSTSKGRRNPRT